MLETIYNETSCQAEYEDGYIHDETFFDDNSPYVMYWDEVKEEGGKWEWKVVGKNIFNDILEKRPEANHGKMVRFSVFYKNLRHDIDWTTLPDNARPIRFRDKNFRINLSTGEQEAFYTGMRYGYQYNEQDGKNVQKVIEL